VNKIIIPSILGIVVLVAGIFAFMPIDNAQTVHTSIGSVISINVDIDDVEDDSTFEITCTNPFYIPQMYIDTSGIGEEDVINVEDILIDGNALDIGVGNFEDLDGEFEDFYGDILDEGDGAGGIGAEETFAFDFQDAEDDADDPVTIIAIIVTNGSCDATFE